MATAATCAACGGVQPPDWKAGDLCAHCGQAVRRDVRCYWCAKATPVAKFCRSCGAAVVEDRLYGAARMLKDAGTDRFTIPKLLVELDPDQIENFTRIYQRQAAAVTRHVDELRFLERFLRQKHWSAALEDELIPQLPWPDATLATYALPPLPAGEDVATAKAIQGSSPLPLARSLAALARLSLGDWTAYPDALEAFRSKNDALRAEAVILLSSWRVRHAVERQEDPRKFVEELRRSPFKIEAAVALAALSREPVELPPEAVHSDDRDVALGAALILGDVDRLCAALRGDPLEQLAAGCALARLGVFAPLEAPLREGPDALRAALVHTLSNSKKPAPELGTVLLELVETTKDESLRERAARVLSRAFPPGAVRRIAKAADNDRSIFQTLLQADGMEAGDRVELVDFLLDGGGFTMNQYGLKDLAEDGTLPDDYVPSRYGRADEKTKLELLRFAEVQLEKRGDEALHGFVLNTFFGPPPAAVRAAACWVLRRWYRHQGDHRSEGPFKLERKSLQRYAGPLTEFLPRLAALLRDPATLKEVGVYDTLATLFGPVDIPTLEDFWAEEAATHDLMRALLEAVRGDYWPGLIDSFIQFLGQVGTKALWRDEVLRGLEALGKKGNYHYDKAIQRLRLAAHGLPDESTWSVLPDDLVPERYPSAPAATRTELLRLAEVQLRQRKDPGLLRFLLNAAFSEGEDAQRREAMNLYAEFAPDDGQLPLSAQALKPVFGSLAELPGRLTSVFLNPVLSSDARFLRFLEHLFEKAESGSLHALTADEETGQALIRSMQDFLQRPIHRQPSDVTLRNELVKALGHLGQNPRWREDVLAVLKPLERDPALSRNTIKDACERLEPPAPPEPEAPVPGERPEENPYEVKGRLAQRMGVELQAAIQQILAGDDSPAEKMRKSTQLSTEFQARIKELYNA